MKKLIISILIFITFFSCKSTYCPSFPENLEYFFPYVKGDVINFIDQNNDTLQLIVNENLVSDSYSIKWNCKCSCVANLGFTTDLETEHLLGLEGAIIIHPEENKSELSIKIYNAQLNSDTFTIIVENLNPYLVDTSNIFGDTIRIQKEDYNRIRSILIIKGKGIVEFFDKNQNCNWIKIE